MLKDILTIRGTVFEFAKDGEELTVDAWETKLVGGIDTSFLTIVFDFDLELGSDLFDSAWLDTAIFDEGFHGSTGDFTSDWVEAADSDDLWGVIDDEVNTKGAFKDTDVSSFTSDDASFGRICRKRGREDLWPWLRQCLWPHLPRS